MAVVKAVTAAEDALMVLRPEASLVAAFLTVVASRVVAVVSRVEAASPAAVRCKETRREEIGCVRG